MTLSTFMFTDRRQDDGGGDRHFIRKRIIRNGSSPIDFIAKWWSTL